MKKYHKIWLYLLSLSLLLGNEGSRSRDGIEVVSSASDSKCGIHCIYLLEKYFGITPDLEEIERSSQYDPIQGTSLFGLRKALETVGLQVETRNIAVVDDSDKITYPFIAHVYSSHWVIVYHMTKEMVFFVDVPNIRIWEYEEFIRIWDGISLSCRQPSFQQDRVSGGNQRDVNSRPDRIETASKNDFPVRKKDDDVVWTKGKIDGNESELYSNSPLELQGESVIYYDKVTLGTVLRGRFLFENVTTTPQRLGDVISSCDCTRIFTDSNEIAPQEITSVSYEIDTTDKVGVNKTTIIVEIVDAAYPLPLSILYNVELPFSIDPPRIHFPVLQRDSTEHKVFKITVKPVSNESPIIIKSISTTANFVSVVYDSDLVGVPLLRARTITGYILPNQISTATNSMLEYIKITFKGKNENEIKVPISGFIARSIECQPSRLLLRKVNRSTDPCLLLSALPGINLPTSEISIDDPLGILQLSRIESLSTGVISARVRVNWDHMLKLDSASLDLFQRKGIAIYVGSNRQVSITVPVLLAK